MNLSFRWVKEAGVWVCAAAFLVLFVLLWFAECFFYRVKVDELDYDMHCHPGFISGSLMISY